MESEQQLNGFVLKHLGLRSSLDMFSYAKFENKNFIVLVALRGRF